MPGPPGILFGLGAGGQDCDHEKAGWQLQAAEQVEGLGWFHRRTGGLSGSSAGKQGFGPDQVFPAITESSLVQDGLKPRLLVLRAVPDKRKPARLCRAGLKLVAEGRLELPTFGL